MPQRAAPMLVIVDGGLESLVTQMLLDHPERATAWFATTSSGEERDARDAAARAQADLLEIGSFEDPVWAPGDGDEPTGIAWSRLLMDAAAAAYRLRTDRVLWPHICGGDPDGMLKESDRMLLVSRLFGVDLDRTDRASLRIDAPLLDLRDDQIADLAADLDAPIRACWWAAVGGGEIPAAGQERARWESAFKAVDAAWMLESDAGVGAPAATGV